MSMTSNCVGTCAAPGGRASCRRFSLRTSLAIPGRDIHRAGAGKTRDQRSTAAAMRLAAGAILFLSSAGAVCAQAPSYSKDIRPIIAKYCSECHNAKTMKGSLSLETHKAMMEGSDNGPVIVAGQPDKSKLVLMCEGKEKPMMPPAKAKFHPSKAEVAQLRAWVAAGAKDDGAEVKVVLPAIKAKRDGLAPVTAMAYSKPLNALFFARKNRPSFVEFTWGNEEAPLEGPDPKDEVITGISVSQKFGIIHCAKSIPGKGASVMTVGFGGGHTRILDDVRTKHTDTVLDIASDENGTWATGGYDGQIQVGRVFRLKEPKLYPPIKEHSDAVYGLAFSPDGKLLASVSADRAMKVFDVEKGKLLYTLGDATDWLYCVAWSPDGKYLVSGGVDKSIRVYDGTRPLTGLGSPKLVQSVFAHQGAVLKLVFTSDSKTLYSVGEDRVVKAWDIEKMTEKKVYDPQPETVLCLALREDAGQFIVGRYDGIVQLIDMKTGKVAHEFGKEKPPPKPRDKLERSRGSQPQEAVTAQPKADQPAKGKGVLDRAGATWQQRLEMKKGESLAVRITVEAKAKFEPELMIADSQGRVLATSTEGHLGHTFAEAGVYWLSVRDREFRGGPDYKFQLNFDPVPIVTEIFPMGMQRGTTADIHLDGVFLPRKTLTVTAPKDATSLALPLDKGTLGKTQIVVGEFPEVSGGGKISVPGTANGHLRKDNQKDLWSFTAKKGERLIVEVNARRIGSRLDSIIEILDKNDQPVPRAVLRAQAKTNVTFRDHDSAAAGIRIDAWPDLAVNDLLLVGNELVKIQSLPTHPDADCIFFAADGKRLGYLDTTPTHHANGTPMYKVAIHPPGSTFPPNGYPVFTLYYKNDDGGPGYGRDSRILFDPPADGEFKVRISDTRGMGGVNFGYRLTVRRPSPSFNVRFNPATAKVPESFAAPISILVDRIDGYEGPIDVRFDNLPGGFDAPPTTIEAGQFSTVVALSGHTTAMRPMQPLTLLGEAVIAGKKVRKEFTGGVPAIIGAGDIQTYVHALDVALKPGGQAKVTVRIERLNGFKGRVPLEVRGLPHGVRVLDIGLNGILVNEGETTRTVVLYAEPWVQPMERPFVVLAKREGKGTEHAAKAVMLKVK